jgi:hypothetical protein
MDSPLYATVQAGFVLLTFASILLFVSETRKSLRHSALPAAVRKRFLNRMITALVLWGLFVSAWSLSGRMADFSLFPLNMLPVFIVPLITLVVLMLSGTFTRVMAGIPVANIIRLQSFRFFVEILLWGLLTMNLLPVQMTFEGRNFDILSGITAPLIALLVSRGKISRRVLILWNVVCLGLLFNIVITAIVSTPSPWRIFMNEPANYIVTYFPIAWLPGMLVPFAYFLHAISLMQLLRKADVAAANVPIAQ